MLNKISKKGIYLKILFDGYDFIRTDFGSVLINNNLVRKDIQKTCYLEKLDLTLKDFNYFLYNNEGYLPISLMNKYNVGKYSLNQIYDKNNPLYNSEYILFNINRLELMFKKYPEIKNLSFWVCPSFNEKGIIDSLGFRVTNTKDVDDAFKWIFTCGNNIIYGRDTVDKDNTCYIVEGFRDYVALKESGYNAIGLGSVFISKQQEAYINTLKEPILLLDNDSFGLQQSLQFKDKGYRVATLIKTIEKDAYDTFSKGIPIRIVEIK